MNTDSAREDAVTLEILDAVERDERVSQRFLAQNLGVALGLANSYLKRCIKKGWVKVRQAPANRYLYYLTPKGFAEKSRLTAAYLSASLSFYRQAGDSCLEVFNECERNAWHRLLLCGVSELAEIATLRAMERNVTIIGFYDPATEREQFLNRPVWRELRQAEVHDARILTDIAAPHRWRSELGAEGDSIPFLVPDVLRLEPSRA